MHVVTSHNLSAGDCGCDLSLRDGRNSCALWQRSREINQRRLYVPEMIGNAAKITLAFFGAVLTLRFNIEKQSDRGRQTPRSVIAMAALFQFSFVPAAYETIFATRRHQHETSACDPLGLHIRRLQ
jgi:hypothetical protein